MPVPVATAKKARFKGLNVPAPATQVGATALGPPKKGLPPTPQQAAPPPPVYGAAPPTAQGQAIRSDADKARMGADTDYRDAVYRSVMGLGDPTQIAKYQQDPTFAGYQFSVDPTSTFSQLDQAQKTGIQNVDNAAVQGNTFFSGLRLNNQEDVRQDTNNQRAASVRDFQTALGEYARQLAAAQAAKEQAYTGANTVDFNAANAVEPEPAAVAGPVSPSLTASQFAAAQKKRAQKKGKK